MNSLKSWWNTRKINPEDDLSVEKMSELMREIKFERKIKKALHIFWTALIGICTVVAAVFSVLTYFK